MTFEEIRERACRILEREGVDPLDATQDQWSYACSRAREMLQTLELIS